MDRYPGLRAAIKEEFGTVYRFCQESRLPQATVKQLILGNLGERAEANAKQKIEIAFGQLRKQRDLVGLWVRQDPQEANNIMLEVPPGTQRVRINLSVSFNFE